MQLVSIRSDANSSDEISRRRSHLRAIYIDRSYGGSILAFLRITYKRNRSGSLFDWKIRFIRSSVRKMEKGRLEKKGTRMIRDSILV